MQIEESAAPLTPGASSMAEPHLSRETLQRLGRLRPAIALGRIALEWTAVVAIAWAAARSHAALYPLAVLLIASRQHSLLVLMHDGAHFRLVANKRANELIADLFAAWPMFTTTARYREDHLAHHRFTSVDGDPTLTYQLGQPKFRFPQSPRQFGAHVVKGALGFEVLKMFLLVLGGARGATKGPADRPSRDRRAAVLRLLFYGTAICAVTALGGWRSVLLYWIVPAVTALVPIIYLRSLLEHYGVRGEDEYSLSRTTRHTFLARLLVTPNNVHYHLEHHLHPGVPYYNLPALHEELIRQPAFRERAHLSEGLGAALGEILCSPSPRSVS